MTKTPTPPEPPAFSRLQIVREGGAAEATARLPRRGKITVDIDSVVPDPRNERKQLRGIEELAATLRQHGLIEPPTAVPLDDGRFLLTTGHRRLAAARLAGKKRIDILVGDPEEESKRRIKSLISNIQREDLGPVELANALQDLKDDNPEIRTNRDLAAVIGKSEQWVGQMLRILTLPQPVQQQITQTDKPVPYDIAIEIARLDDAPSQQALVRQALQGATVRAIREQAKSLKTVPPRRAKPVYTTRKLKIRRGWVIIHHELEAATWQDDVAALEEALQVVQDLKPGP